MPQEIILGIAATVVTIIASAVSLAYWLGRKLARIEGSVKGVEERTAISIRSVEERLMAEIKGVEQGLRAEIKGVEERTTVQIRGVEEKMARVAEASRSQLEFFTEFLAFREVLAAKDVLFVKGELARLSAMVGMANPLTKEEARRLKELIEKEKLTLQEADELRAMARRLTEDPEYGRRPEAWKLLIYASIMRGIAIREAQQPT